MDVTLNELQRETIEVEHYTASLFTAYISGAGLSAIVNTAAGLLGNPVIVFDASFKIVAHSGHKISTIICGTRISARATALMTSLRL